MKFFWNVVFVLTLAVSALEAFSVGNLDLKVAVVTHNPWMTNVAEIARGRRMNAIFSWPTGYNMAKDQASWWFEASHGMVKVTFVTNVVLDTWPRYVSGDRFTPQSYYDARKKGIKPSWNTSFTFDYMYFYTNECPWIVEYINKGIIDQVWLYSHPDGGCYESRLNGWGADYCNSNGLGTLDSEKVFMMCTPSMERTDTPMENFGHAAESMLHTRWDCSYINYHPWRDYSKKNDFVLFNMNYAIDTNNIQVGTVHYAPNSTNDYLWGMKNYVDCYADNWYNYPDLSGPARSMNCSEWGGGVNHKHKIWWFKHFPQKVGLHRGQMMNWLCVYLNPAKAAHPIGVGETITQEDVDFAGFFPFSFELPAGTTQAVVKVTTGIPVEFGIRKKYVPMNSRNYMITGPNNAYEEWTYLRDTEKVWTLTEDNCFGQVLTGKWYITFGKAYDYSLSRPFDDNTNYVVSVEAWPKVVNSHPPELEVTKPLEGERYDSAGKITWEINDPPADGWLSFNLAYSTNDFRDPWIEISEDYAFELKSPYNWKNFPSGVKSDCARIRLIANDLHGNAYTNYSGLFGIRLDPVPEPALAIFILTAFGIIFRKIKISGE